MDFWARRCHFRTANFPPEVGPRAAADMLLEPVEPRDIIVSKIQPTCVSKQASICADRKQPVWCSIAMEHGVMLSWRWYTGSVGLPHVEVSQ
jgi:hypothetical protein